MSWMNNLQKIIETGMAISTVYEANKWIEEKASQLGRENQRIAALVDIACHVGYMDNDTWQTFIAGLGLKATLNDNYSEMKTYCDYVVQIEVGKYAQLTRLPLRQAKELLADILLRGALYERCAYLGLLMAKSQNHLISSQLYKHAQGVLTANSTSQRRTISNRANSSPAGKINNVTLNLDQYSEGVKGVQIIASLEIDNAAGLNCQLIAWFEFSNGQVLKDGNGRYKSGNGQVATYDNFSPRYESSVYKAFKLFLPYDELHLEKEGRHDIRFNLGLFVGNDKLSVSGYKNFSITYS